MQKEACRLYIVLSFACGSKETVYDAERRRANGFTALDAMVAGERREDE